MATSQSPPATIGKRARPLTPRRSSTTSSTSSGLSSSSTTSPETKIARSSRSSDTSFSNGSGSGENVDDTDDRIGGNRPILCTLPPTCNRHPITLANSKELERHYATYHAHVCEQDGCGCVFPEAKLLELHQTECHDPLAAVRKERGEKIFGCMVTTCARYFQSPKTRRLHMIEAHKYPKEFFFAVTNKGIGGLLKKWGEGASMIRGEWKPRNQDTNTKKTKEELEKNFDERMMRENNDNDDEDKETSSEEGEAVEEIDMEELEKTPRPGVRSLHPASPPGTGNARSNVNTDVDALAEGMSSLTLIPSSIRFGRGGRGGGLGARGRGRGGRGGIVLAQVGAPNTGGHQRSASTSSVTDNKQLGMGAVDGRGRGGKKAKGHRVSTSIGTGMEIDVPSRGGGDIVLLPAGASGAERGRGSGRGRRGSGKGSAH